MANCYIDTESLRNCLAPPIGGAENFVMLYNYPEWVAMKEAGLVTFAADGSIDGITNASGVQAFRFDIADPTALQTGYPDRKVDGGIDGYDHTFNFSILGTKQAQKNQIFAMKETPVVAIIYKKNGTGEIYGNEQGLEIQTNTANVNDPALGAVIPVQLITSPRIAPENKPPLDIFDTDAATTRALIEGLNIASV